VTVPPDPDASGSGMDQTAAYLERAVRCGTPEHLASYTVRHLRDVTDAEWGECLRASPGELELLATADPDLTAELMSARQATGEPPAPGAVRDDMISITDLSCSSPWPLFADLAIRTTPVRSAVLP
jgi:hypothetical protein